MELIKVKQNEKGEQLVSGRELYEFLEVKTPYKKWFDRMSEYGFVENVDFAVLDKKVQDDTAFGGYRYVTDHAIKLSMAKELSMIQRTEKGKQARLYFIECERRLKEVTQPKLPQTYLEALKELVAKEEALQLANQTIMEQAPKVEYHDKVLHSDKLVTTTQIAKDLGMSAIKLNKILNEKGIIFKKSNTWFFYDKYQSRIPKYADYVIGENFQQLKWTELGRKWIIEIVTKVLEDEM